MDSNVLRHISALEERYPQLSVCNDAIKGAYEIMEQAYANGRKLLVCGNGGSASDSEHIVGELMKEFKLKRKVYKNQAEAMKRIDSELGSVLAEHLQGALPAITLTGHSSLTTAFMNDSLPELIFAQQVNGYGKAGDVFLGISTSGNSRNVLFAAVAAKAKGLKVIGLTGAKDCRLAHLADLCIQVPETETYKIQELHLPVYHCLCMMLEEHFFGK
ncbi:MAG: SIS domain-containing protein [Prevotella sp.]|nr:SIS domain-containing protein [Prevotella sp.]